ncbi:hypothetical protein BDZ91DRAFT_791810 [Kalaharituber pfeilii]|nr:hypothetical protein BDZ91DRAFT_791810 [Kalaharituber pfeilii]
MDDNQKKRKTKWNTSYSNLTWAQAQRRLGIRFQELKEIPVQRMLKHSEWVDLHETKEEVYKEIKRFLRIAGTPTEDDPSVNESSINHLVYAIISPIFERYIETTGRENVQAQFEREIISIDGETGGTEEFVIVAILGLDAEKFIFVVESKRSCVAQAMKQCLLSMKDMWEHNGGGKIYGFVTTGKSWRMIGYDGGSFEKSEEMLIFFDTMGSDKKRWMDSFSIVVDCIYYALTHGGIVAKQDVVAGQNVVVGK